MLQERSQFVLAERMDAQPANARKKAKKEHSEMAIQWFPGHMHLTKKAIQERIKEIDVVIELLDARLPGSSANPMLAELTGAKPALKVLNKQDLADPARTALWLAHYNSLPGTRAIGLDASMSTRPPKPSSRPAMRWHRAAAAWSNPCAC